MRFLGRTEYSLDRRRVPIPQQYRALFAEGGVVTVGTGPFIELHTHDSFDRAAALIDALPADLQSAHDARLDFYSNASYVKGDSQWRVLLPESLVEHAGLERDVLVVGVGYSLQIWDKSTFLARGPEFHSARQVHMARQDTGPGSAER